MADILWAETRELSAQSLTNPSFVSNGHWEIPQAKLKSHRIYVCNSVCLRTAKEKVASLLQYGRINGLGWGLTDLAEILVGQQMFLCVCLPVVFHTHKQTEWTVVYNVTIALTWCYVTGRVDCTQSNVKQFESTVFHMFYFPPKSAG